MTSRNKLFICYLLLIAFHCGHILEESWGQFWMVDKIGSPAVFLLINWVLLFIPLALFYLVIQGKRTAYYLSIVYASFMVLNGAGHNIATLVTGRYRHGFAGGFSGLGLIITGIPLVMLLYKNMPNKK